MLHSWPVPGAQYFHLLGPNHKKYNTATVQEKLIQDPEHVPTIVLGICALVAFLLWTSVKLTTYGILILIGKML